MSSPRPPRFVTDAFSVTDEQLRIQTAPHKSLLIEAAAGAAKTTTLALRMAEALALGARPQRLLALTFTPTAVLALRQTLRRIGVAPELLSELRIETFDGYAAAVLRRVESIDGRDPVQSLSRPEQLKPHVWDAIALAADNPSEHHPDELNLPSYGSDTFIGQFLQRIERVKAGLLLQLRPAEGADSPDYALDELGIDYTLLRLLRSYEALRWPEGQDAPLFRGPLDATHDLARLLLPVPEGEIEVGLPLGTFDEVFVDEMHDCNEAMFTVLKALLRAPERLFCAVGDRHQVIHQHSGADARFMGPALDQETGRTVQRLPLSQSFRYGASLAGWMSRHTGKTIRAADSCRTELVHSLYGESGQAGCEEAVVAALKRWRSEQRKDAVYSSCAVLLRHESQSVLLENALHAQGIAHKFIGFGSYLQRPEVLFVRSVYAIATGRLDTLGGASTRRLIPAALFEMTQARVVEDDDPDYRTAEAFVREAAQHAAESESVIESLFTTHVMARAPAVVKQRLARALDVAREPQQPQHSGFERFLAALDMPAFARAVFVEQERRDEVQRHTEGLLAAARQHASALAFFRALQAQDEANAQRLQDHAAGKVRSNKLATAAITLAVVADVKGLEFEHVLLPYLAQGVFPQARAELADERNLFYVAATRAKQRLSLIAPAQRPSRFLPER
jgi:DNA helicase-2/ATP-dependent DNA helicase PcrA